MPAPDVVLLFLFRLRLHVVHGAYLEWHAFAGASATTRLLLFCVREDGALYVTLLGRVCFYSS